MRKKILVFVFSILLLLLLVITTSAHSGMTDASGGHMDEENNEYHYHCGGNPAHKHYGGICPYNRIPVDTSSNKGNYGSGNSITREENTMETWELILLCVVGVIVFLIIFNAIKEKIQDNKRAIKCEQEIKNTETNEKIVELNRKISNLEKENAELKRVNIEKSGIIVSLNSLRKEQSDELSKLREEKEALQGLLQNANNTVADANYEVIKTREKDRIDIESLTQNLVHAFNDYEVLNKYYRSTSKGKLENAFNTNLTVSKILKFNLEAEIISEGVKGINKYITTFENCSCEDYKYRCQKEGTACKHMLYLMYSFGVLQLQPERLKASFLVGKNKNN